MWTDEGRVESRRRLVGGEGRLTHREQTGAGTIAVGLAGREQCGGREAGEMGGVATVSKKRHRPVRLEGWSLVVWLGGGP